MFQPREVIQASKELLKCLDVVNKTVVGRRPIVHQIAYALLTGNHVLLEGPPGVAKSFLADCLFKNITDARYFHVQCTKKMTEDYLLGPLDMARFREQGDYLHKVEGYLPTAHVAFLDEFMDLSSGALRSLLGILNERTFSRGPQKLKCPLITAIACTNFAGNGEDEKSYEAVKDRFLFKARILPLPRLSDRKAMFAKPPEPKSISIRGVRLLRSAVTKVLIPEAVLDAYLQLCSGLPMTDRTCKKALDVVRASAVLRGSRIASLEDVMAVETCFTTVGDSASENVFAKAAKNVKDLTGMGDFKVAAIALAGRLTQLRAALRSATTYIGPACAVAYEVREAQQALDHLQRQMPNGCPYSRIIDSARACVLECLRLADDLYAKSQETSK